jgi:hypothetical protein
MGHSNVKEYIPLKKNMTSWTLGNKVKEELTWDQKKETNE